MEYLAAHPLVAPAGALIALLGVLVAIINWQGKKLGKHEELLALLDVRVSNIHKDREATRVQKLQNPLVPPPLPAATDDAFDWSDDDTDTGRYPFGEPPKEGDEG